MIIPISRGISTSADPGKAANEYKSRINKIRNEGVIKEEGITSSKVVVVAAPYYRRWGHYLPIFALILFLNLFKFLLQAMPHEIVFFLLLNLIL